MMKLTRDEREELHQEFQKLCQKGFYINIKTLPQKLQEDIWSSDMINFLSTSPAWKQSSLSTKIRCAQNASKKQKAYGKSLNCLQPVGYSSLDMADTFRCFKNLPGASLADISKYYQQVYLNRESWPLQLLVFKDHADLQNKVEVYVNIRLQYGVISAATLSQIGLELICQYGESSCTECQGRYSVFKSETLSDKCGGIPHKFADSVRYLYVDDCIIKAITQE